ncbi:hypothetical protein F4561_005334 [Lipingzhangella halophila]|uniref:DUF4239 domain-containing protein n=1 Tax=Lipingzhangella halophila TaxID=1783352 RepID=A0A7W7W638_9ACTN|nr:DUF4239 domain-containing protein [Lipingzhangella halophila]MBB4934514.1 hypothetical protein [Lipingzhangella halophila]
MTVNLVLVSGALALVLAIGYLVARKSGISADDYSGPVGTMIAPSVLAIYLIAMAMGIVIGWENKNTAADNVVDEASAATALYWSTQTLPEDSAEPIRQDLRAYLATVIRDDWPAMRGGELSKAGETSLDRLMVSVNEGASENNSGTADQITAHQQMAVLVDQRMQRADSAEDTIPEALKIAVLVSAVAVVVLPFGSRDRGSRASFLWALVNLAFVAVTVVVLFYLDNSYAGVHAIDAQPLENALSGFDRIDRVSD